MPASDGGWREAWARVGRAVVAFLALAFAFLLPSDGVAQTTVRIVRGLEAFHSVTVARGINMTLVMNDEVDKLPADVAAKLLGKKGLTASPLAPTCVVRAEPSVARAVDCAVENGCLTISAGTFKYRKTKRIDVYVVCDSTLSLIHGTSGSNIWTRGCLRLGDVSVLADFAMEVHITANASSMSLVAANRSYVWLTGTLGSLHCTLKAASSLNMRKKMCARANVTAQGESRAEVSATEALDINATKGSSVRYFAPGARVSQSTDQTSWAVAL